MLRVLGSLKFEMKCDENANDDNIHKWKFVINKNIYLSTISKDANNKLASLFGYFIFTLC